MLSLKAQNSVLSDPRKQLALLNDIFSSRGWPSFRETLDKAGLDPLTATSIDTLQVNVGRLCNQTCRHCHVDAGPDRTEQMDRQTFDLCIQAVKNFGINSVDITGGAPELNPHLISFIETLSSMGTHIMVRSNLTVLTVARYRNLPEFFARHGVEVISSLPFYSKGRTDLQRGEGVFEKSIEALRQLNALGYGKIGTGLVLNLVYNPTGILLPGSQSGIEQEFRKNLLDGYGVEFNRLYTITNMPISRFLDSLEQSGKTEEYLGRLVASFNPVAASEVMCRSLISVGYDGTLYDCDFNQMLDLPITTNNFHIRDFSAALLKRNIAVNEHCWGCTAGSGSSCGGATT